MVRSQSLIHDRISDSAKAFVDKVWPIVSGLCGGGRIVSVESLDECDLFRQALDVYSGIDGIQIDDRMCRARGLSSRVQSLKHKPYFESFTVRFARASGLPTEFDKRLRDLQGNGGWLCPAIAIHSYFRPTEEEKYGRLRAVGVAYMRSLIRVILEGKKGDEFGNDCDWYIQSTMQKWGQSDNTLFAVVKHDGLKRMKERFSWRVFGHE